MFTLFLALLQSFCWAVWAIRKMTYSIGLTYGAGLLTGGFYGGLLGIRQGGATPKLFLNSVLNSCSRYGPALANQSAIITMYYVPWWKTTLWLVMLLNKTCFWKIGCALGSVNMCQCGLCPFFWRLIYRKKPKNQEWDQDGQKICLRYTLASFCVAIKPSSSCMNLLHVTCTY